MKRAIEWLSRLKPVFLGSGLFLVLRLATNATGLPADWLNDQPFGITAAGFTKLSLPVETLDAARPTLEDVRLFDASGNEVPFVIERPVPTVKIVQTVKSFRPTLQASSTVLVIETGLSQPLDTVTLESPAGNFLKAVRVEGSADGKTWQALAQGQPIFRQFNGASHVQVAFPPGLYAWLRLTVDDQHSAPIPFTSARVHATVVETAPTEWSTADISERTENPGETRLALNLGAANLDIASVKIETTEPLFLRQLRFAVPQIADEAIREQVIGQGVAYRVAIEGQPASERLFVPLEAPVRSRELVLFMSNEDSPPLPISSVKIERRPVYLAFLAKQPGAYHLLTGNPRCAAPKYDLAALGMNLKSVAVAAVTLPAPAPNPDFRPGEVLPGVEDGGVALDVSDWKFREPLKLARSGAQKLELNPEVLSQAQAGFADLRLVRDGQQLPYILEHTSISRAIKPRVTATNDAKDKTLSRWIIRLPQPRLPLARLTCATTAKLFDRDVTLYEETTDERGEKFRRLLAQANWTQKPDRPARQFMLPMNEAPQSDTLVLETRNGDNPPIGLENFQVFYPATRVLFKSGAGGRVFLYYGNPRANAPRYDLSLVADQLLAAERSTALAGAAEPLRKSLWSENQKPGAGGVVFWGILAVVVIVLLVIISRLLPKAPAQ